MYKNKIYSGAISVVAAGLMLGCSNSYTAAEIETPVDTPVIARAVLSVSGTVVDAATNTPIGDVNITYAGKDIASLSELQHVSQADSGLVAFSASKNTITVSVQAHKEGYVDTGVEVSTVDQNTSGFTIKMVKLNNPPAGIAVKSETIVATDNQAGTIQRAVVVKADVNNSSTSNGESTTVTIPVDTVVTDENNDTVEGLLEMVVSHYSASDESSTEAFPGGFAVSATTSTPGATTATEEDISFVTAGFTSIVIKNPDGVKVKNFSVPIEVKMQIREGVSNPETGKPILLGEKVPVWSYNEDIGKWAREQDDGTIVDLNTTDGFYDVVVQATHLSYWNLDWHYSAVCRNNIRLNVRDSNGALVTNQSFYMRANFVGSSGYLYNGYIRNDGFADLRNVPLDKTLEIKSYLSSDRNTALGNTTITVSANDCNIVGGKTYDIEIDTTQFPVLLPQTIQLKENCDNGILNRTDISNVLVYAYDKDWNYLGYKYTDTSGQATFNVTQDEVSNYRIRVGNVSGWATTSYYDQVSYTTLDADNDGKSDAVMDHTVTLTGNTAQCLPVVSGGN